MRVRKFLARSPVQIAFDIGIFFKGLDGVLEIMGGLLLFVVKPQTVTGIITTLTQHELSEDPHDLIASQLVQLAQDYSGLSYEALSQCATDNLRKAIDP